MTRERPIAGEHIVITGATSGIGQEMARGVAKRGALLTVVARNRAKADRTADELASEPGAAGRPEIVIGDLGDLASVRHAAATILDKHDRIDVLIDNAGVNLPRAQTSPDGFDLMMATNYLGPFLFTNLLLDAVIAATPSRIVVTGSEAHRACQRPDLARLGEPASYKALGGQLRYGQSKLMDILFATELAERLEGTGATVNSFCPGLVATGLAGDHPLQRRAFDLVARTPLMRRPDQGAKMGLRLVLDPDLQDVSGRFFSSTPGAPLLPDARSRRDARYRKEAWIRTADLVGLTT